MKAADRLLSSPKSAFRFGLVVVFFASLIPYSAVYSFEYVLWDDNVYLIERPEIHGGLTGDGIRWAFTTFQNANWHPLTWLSYMLEIELFGLNPGVMHLTNLGLHCLNTALVACVVKSLTENRGMALGVALLFGVHPQHVEAVAWVSERKELLCIFFGLQSMIDTSVSLALVCGAILLAAGVWVFRNRRHPGILAGSLWFVGTLIPVIGIVQLGAASRADRYVYFPHIGLFLCIGSLPVFQQNRRPIAVASLLLVAATCCSILTWRQSQIWRNSISLWTACLEADPDSFRGHEQLALALLVDEQIDEALTESQIALRYIENRSLGGTYTTLGCAQLFSGDIESAVKNLREAIRIRPDDYRALINLGYALRMTDLSESKRLFAQALEYSPTSVEAMGNLANCEAEEGNFAGAIELLRTAIKIDPENTQLKENLWTFREAQRLIQSH